MANQITEIGDPGTEGITPNTPSRKPNRRMAALALATGMTLTSMGVANATEIATPYTHNNNSFTPAEVMAMEPYDEAHGVPFYTVMEWQTEIETRKIGREADAAGGRADTLAIKNGQLDQGIQAGRAEITERRDRIEAGYKEVTGDLTGGAGV